MEDEFNFKTSAIRLNFYSEQFDDPSPELKNLIQNALEILSEKSEKILNKKFQGVEVNLNLISDEEMRVLNRDHRNKDQATDVLSFPLQENVRRGEYDAFEGQLELGDIFVANGVCSFQAKDNGLSFEQEFVHLLAHGYLHLAGYDHEESDEEDRLMRSLENEIMDELGARRLG